MQHIPSVQDSSTGTRHSSVVLGNFVATKAQNMNVMESSSKSYSKLNSKIESAKSQMKQAQEGMKKMELEIKDFESRMMS